MAKKTTRRGFLRGAAATAAGAALFPNIVRAETLGNAKRTAANSRLALGVIGLGGRGTQVMHAFMAQPDVQVRAVCDVKGDRRGQGLEAVHTAYHDDDCKPYIDFREVLGRDDIDIVLIATGDNWHSGVSICAAHAGKDIYCEKPMSVTLAESRAVSDTMTRLGRVYQCGTQRRSISHFRFAVRLAQTGKLGKLTELHAEEAGAFQVLNYDVLPEQPLPPREEFDWDMWLGPAQWRPYNAEYPTRGYWSGHVDFSGGSITEWGSHTVDICQWANSADNTGPVRFWKEGDWYMGEYENGAKLIIRTGLRFGSCPVKIVGEEGWVETGDSGEIDAYPKSLLGDRLFEGGYPPDNHVRAFLDCVYTREEPIARAEHAHRSISACHIANLVKRLGREIEWDPVTETCPHDPEANRLLSRAYREPWRL